MFSGGYRPLAPGAGVIGGDKGYGRGQGVAGSFDQVVVWDRDAVVTGARAMVLPVNGPTVFSGRVFSLGSNQSGGRDVVNSLRTLPRGDQNQGGMLNLLRQVSLGSEISNHFSASSMMMMAGVGSSTIPQGGWPSASYSHSSQCQGMLAHAENAVPTEAVSVVVGQPQPQDAVELGRTMPSVGVSLTGQTYMETQREDLGRFLGFPSMDPEDISLPNPIGGGQSHPVPKSGKGSNVQRSDEGVSVAQRPDMGNIQQSASHGQNGMSNGRRSFAAVLFGMPDLSVLPEPVVEGGIIGVVIPQAAYE
ncbi:hypothetical protein NE237_030310 [Protea cynaroides]|uniref:Uncharacterized protein n=1 Tax=Protea cynaroides TaxID=273540 RepID=A0A9Q0JX40_9MAGN|nr:hypothetical protein NE237_030310 [Protea cynaroides]